MRKVVSGYRLIFGYLGIFLIVVGIICLLPLFMLIGYPEEANHVWNFLIPGLSSIGAGIALMCLIIGRDKAQLGKHQDSVLLVMVWVSAILVCAVPFAMSKIQLGDGGMTFTEAVFESTSGYATVGLTRLTSELFNYKIYLFFRILLQFFGGVGLVLVVTSAISDRYGLKLYTAEGHNDKLMPNLAKSARLILGIYFLYIALGTVAYIIAGMDWFDALNHSVCAVATGGFSSRPGGLFEILATMPEANVIAIEVISCVLMVLGGTNFLIHLFLLTGKWKKIVRDCEIRLFFSLCLIFIPLYFICIWFSGLTTDPWLAFRYGTFTFFSNITTTGFSNLPSINVLTSSALFMIVMLNIVGAGIGSTAGGAKQYRFAVALKSFYWNCRDRLSNKQYIYPYYIWRFGERKEVSKTESIDAYGYIMVYCAVLLFGSLMVTLFGINEGVQFGDALFEFSNALSSTGLSNGVTAMSNPAMLWVFTAGMFAGRLEILAIYFAFFRIAKDIFRKETI